jgi:hypothetical protein
MKFYFFNGNANTSNNFYELGFSGFLMLYNSTSGDQFINVAKRIDPNKDFKYMVALRPYAMSPQYLCMINDTIQYFAKDKLQINLISGYTKPEEESYNAFVGDVNDNSSKIEKSKYLIKYLDVINNMKVKIPDIYVSTTNEYVMETCIKYKNKMIVPYPYYLKIKDKLKDQKVMVSVGPILRETEKELDALDKEKFGDERHFYTVKEFSKILLILRCLGIEEILIYALPDTEISYIKNFVHRFKTDPILYKQVTPPVDMLY